MALKTQFGLKRELKPLLLEGFSFKLKAVDDFSPYVGNEKLSEEVANIGWWMIL